jgi:hypothetical protein
VSEAKWNVKCVLAPLNSILAPDDCKHIEMKAG